MELREMIHEVLSTWGPLTSEEILQKLHNNYGVEDVTTRRIGANCNADQNIYVHNDDEYHKVWGINTSITGEIVQHDGVLVAEESSIPDVFVAFLTDQGNKAVRPENMRNRIPEDIRIEIPDTLKGVVRIQVSGPMKGYLDFPRGSFRYFVSDNRPNGFTDEAVCYSSAKVTVSRSDGFYSYELDFSRLGLSLWIEPISD